MESNSILESLRNRIIQGESFANYSWIQEVEQIYKSGVGLDEALQYLYFEKPTINQFEKWISEKQPKNSVIEAITENVLTDEDLDFFDKNGYLVLKNAISEEDCLKTQQIIWNFLDINPNDASTWYKNHPEQKGMMVNFFDHPQLDKNRNSAKIRRAFEQLYQSTKIYKTIDKVSFNAPVTKEHKFRGSNLHWDVSLRLPIPFQLQGLIYLSDCGANEGAFHCVPGFHTSIEQWLSSVPSDRNPREYAVGNLEPIPITGKSGDMVIWHQALPHCATPNQGEKPRMVQYLSYFAEGYQEQEDWI